LFFKINLFFKNSYLFFQFQGLQTPPPFIVSTSLDFNLHDRHGKSYPDGHGNVIVEGVRIPDDHTDVISHRSGKFINNVFVPDDVDFGKTF